MPGELCFTKEETPICTIFSSMWIAFLMSSIRSGTGICVVSLRRSSSFVLYFLNILYSVTFPISNPIKDYRKLMTYYMMGGGVAHVLVASLALLNKLPCFSSSAM